MLMDTRGELVGPRVNGLASCLHHWQNLLPAVESKSLAAAAAAAVVCRCDLGPNNFQDIMAATKCSDPVPQIGLFSSPGLTYNDYPVGDRQKADCARALSESVSVIARYRDAKCAPGRWWCEASSSCIDVESCCTNADCGLVGDRLVYCAAPGTRCGVCPAGTKSCGHQCISTAQVGSALELILYPWYVAMSLGKRNARLPRHPVCLYRSH